MRDGCHTVTSGTCSVADGVQEPNVYVLLPKAWLSQAGLAPRMRPLPDSVREERMDPAAALAATWSDHTLYDQSSVNPILIA